MEVAPAVTPPLLPSQHSVDSHGRGASAEKSRESFVDYYLLRTTPLSVLPLDKILAYPRPCNL